MNSFYSIQNEKVIEDREISLQKQVFNKFITWQASDMIIVRTENDYKHEYVPRRRLALADEQISVSQQKTQN